jgi:hypothetical protein
MAKSSLPSVDDYKKPTVRKPSVKEVCEERGSSVDEVVDSYIPRNVDVRMNRAQARILRDKLRTLQDSGAKTADGRFVDNRAQAVRWIIENEVIV